MHVGMLRFSGAVFHISISSPQVSTHFGLTETTDLAHLGTHFGAALAPRRLFLLLFVVALVG